MPDVAGFNDELPVFDEELELGLVVGLLVELEPLVAGFCELELGLVVVPAGLLLVAGLLVEAAGLFAARSSIRSYIPIVYPAHNGTSLRIF